MPLGAPVSVDDGPPVRVAEPYSDSFVVSLT